MVSVDKILHPGHHGRFAHPVAGVAIGVRVILDVEHAGEGSPIPGPPAAVREEVCCLGAAGTYVGVCKVVPATDEACIGGINVVAREGGVDEIGAFCGLHVVGMSAVIGGK